MISIEGHKIMKEGEQVGWFQEYQLYNKEGQNVGYIENESVYDPRGRKQAFLDQSYFHFQNGQKIDREKLQEKIEGGHASELMRGAIFVFFQ